MVKFRWITVLAFMASGFAFGVIGLGAFTRLIDAGLGCPDWPGCYGRMIIDGSQINSSSFVAYKAWAEMIHRYFAGSLGLLIMIIVTLIFAKTDLRRRINVILASFLILLLIYQILLGQWTVTLKLWPVVVTQHLLGGFFILAILWLIFLNNSSNVNNTIEKAPIHIHTKSKMNGSLLKYDKNGCIFFAFIGLLLLIIQITIGAWTSTNYASLSCPDFPFCFNDQTVTMHWQEAFSFHPVIGVNYEGGILPASIRQTIHMVHRIGALVITFYLIIFSMYALPKLKKVSSLQYLILVMLTLLITQICIGMVNIIFKLPLATALAHNLVASLLLLTMLTLFFRLTQNRKSILE